MTWTRLLNSTAGRRTHTMACAHSELSTGHCGRRIGTKIFQDDSCSSSTRPAERQVRGAVLSKEEGSLPVTPSASNTAAPSRFGGLLARVISASFLCRLGFHVDVFPHWNSSCSFKGISRGHFRRLEPPAQQQVQPPLCQCTPKVRACREPLSLPVSHSMRAKSRMSERCLPTSHVLCAGDGKERR